MGALVLVLVLSAVFIYRSKNNASNPAAEDVVGGERYSIEPTGIDLIDKALADKKIDVETALVYKVKFLFNDPTLPREYFTKNAPFEDAGVFTDVKANWDTLSAATKKELAPYFKRPNDPESYISKALNGEIEAPKVGMFKFINTAQARVRPYSYKSEDALVTADGKIRVWYLEKTETVGEVETLTKIYYDTAKQIVANLNADGAYAQFVGLLGKVPPSDGTFGGDDKTDVYIVPVGYAALLETDGTSSQGVNSPDEGSGDSSFILLREDLSPDHLKTTTVHELFHAFQRAFPWAWRKIDLWWLEGTATWSEDMIYPKINSEQGYVVSFIPRPQVSLNSDGKNFEYGAYLFPFYLSRVYDRGIITKVFERCSSANDVKKSVDAVIDGGFKKNWKEFTLWNYNQKPVEYYKEKDQSKKFTTHSSAVGGNSETNFIVGVPEMPYTVKELKPLTVQVHNFSIDYDQAASVKKVTFDGLKDFTGKSEKAWIKAVVYPKTGEPYVEDWGEKDKRSFCFDKSNEKLDRVSIIFSNAEMTDKIKESTIKVKTADTCFAIDQTEAMASKPIFAVTPGYKGRVKYLAQGELVSGSVPAKAKYAYLGKWRVKVNYMENWPAQTMMGIAQSPMNFGYDHTIEFDLSAASVLKDGIISAVTKEAKFETPGWVIHNQISGESTTVPQTATDWSVPQKGIVSDVSETGCKISFPDFVLYNSGPYRGLPHPIVFEIKTE